jgi:O-antigen/teichoic acid export membrane protein
LATSLGLVTGRVANMATGFLFWLLAARAAEAPAVGLAAGAVSLMMLCTQFAIAGTGSSFILKHTQHGRERARLLDAAITVVLLTSAAASAVALGLVAALFDELGPISKHPLFAVLFVAMTALGTLGILLDHVSVALDRGGDVLVRNCAGGLLSASPVAAGLLLGWQLAPEALFGCWVLGGVLSCGVGALQLRRCLDGYTYRPRLPRALTAELLRTGLPNHALTLVERTPALLLPAVVAEVLSPELNAYWYVAWMMAWAVLVIPVSFGLTMMAQVAREPGAMRAGLRRGVRAGLVLGLGAAVGVAVLGPWLLRVIGTEYADAGAAPLRWLLPGVLPVLVIQTYYAICRSVSRVTEAVAVGSLTAVASVLGPAVAGAHLGLVGMAQAWVAVQVVASVWAGWRLRALVPPDPPGDRRAHRPADPPADPVDADPAVRRGT